MAYGCSVLSIRCSKARKWLVLLISIGTLATGCAGPTEQVTTDDSPGSDGESDRQPGGGDGPLFVSVEVGSGLVPMGHDFRSPPRSVVYDDGTTFSVGAINLIYPGPALLPVIEGQLDDGGIDEILAAAAEAGLDGSREQDFGRPPIADAPTTTITVVIDGEAHATSVYALNETGDRGPGRGEPEEASPGLTPEQEAARDQVREFLDLVSRLVSAAEEGQYEPERYRVLPLDPQTQPDAEVEPDEREWPVESVTLTPGECAAVSGADAEVLGAALREATEITRWRTDSGAVYTLAARAVLPHEPDCPPET